MAFVQIIEFTTTRPDEVEALVAEWRTKTSGRRTAQRGTRAGAHVGAGRGTALSQVVPYGVGLL